MTVERNTDRQIDILEAKIEQKRGSDRELEEREGEGDREKDEALINIGEKGEMKARKGEGEKERLIIRLRDREPEGWCQKSYLHTNCHRIERVGRYTDKQTKREEE